jgi:hypothetical protein
LPRAELCSALHHAAPELTVLLRDGSDEPGHFTVVVLTEQGLVVTGTWQELISGESGVKPRSRHVRSVKS